LISAAAYFPVRNVTWSGDPHLAYGHYVRAEGDVTFDFEPVAAAQRRRPGGEPLLEVRQQSVKFSSSVATGCWPSKPGLICPSPVSW
jgi:hypothetical protein